MELTLADLEQLRSLGVTAFQTRVANIPANQPERFALEVARMEGQLEAIHRILVLAQAHMTDRVTAYAVWHTMLEICDSVLAKLAESGHRDPGTAASQAKILDLRQSVARRCESFSITPG
jgi:hypothetical protein